MRNFTGLEHIIITLVVIAVVFVPMLKNLIGNKAPSVQNSEVNKKTYQAKLIKFNSQINQSLTMIGINNVDLCQASPTKIAENFGKFLNTTKNLPGDYLDKNAPRKFYQNENSEVSLNLDSAIELNDGSIIGFKKKSAVPGNCFDIYVDFNGLNEPNMLGSDTHMFSIKQLSLNSLHVMPAGNKKICKGNSNNLETSLGCTHVMMNNPDMMP